LFEKRLIHEILIPSSTERFIVQFQFIGYTNNAVLLCNTGETIILNVAEAVFLGSLQGKLFRHIAISPDGVLFSGVLLNNKHQVSFFKLSELLENVTVTDPRMKTMSQ
jgi:hypothetical protein